MSKEREWLERIVKDGMLEDSILLAIKEILAKPELSTDSLQLTKQECLSEDEICKGIKSENPIHRSSFILGVKFGEKEHGIGGGNE